MSLDDQPYLSWLLGRSATEARARGISTLRSEHLVLALLQEGSGVEPILRTLDVKPHEWGALLGAPALEPSGQTDRRSSRAVSSGHDGDVELSDEVSEIVSLALTEALESGGRAVQAGHVLAAIRAGGRGHVAAATAGRLGMTLGKIRRAAGLPHSRRLIAGGADHTVYRYPKRSGPLLLVGGGQDAPEAYARAVALARARQSPGNQEIATVLISAGSNSIDSYPKVRRLFKSAGSDWVIDAELRSRSDSFTLEVCEMIRGADIIFFSGGRPELIYESMWATPALMALVDASDNGAVVMGSSAGAMVFGIGIVTDYESGDEKEPFPLFRWLRNVFVFPHYMPEFEEYLREYLRAFPDAMGLGISHSGAALIDAGWDSFTRLDVDNDIYESVIVQHASADVRTLPTVP